MNTYVRVCTGAAGDQVLCCSVRISVGGMHDASQSLWLQTEIGARMVLAISNKACCASADSVVVYLFSMVLGAGQEVKKRLGGDRRRS